MLNVQTWNLANLVNIGDTMHEFSLIWFPGWCAQCLFSGEKRVQSWCLWTQTGYVYIIAWLTYSRLISNDFVMFKMEGEGQGIQDYRAMQLHSKICPISVKKWRTNSNFFTIHEVSKLASFTTSNENKLIVVTTEIILNANIICNNALN